MNQNTHSRNFWGTITARQGVVVALPGGGNKGDPAQITYNAEANDAPEGTTVTVRLVNHAPKRRISRGAKVIVAEVGDPCIIQMRSDKVYLWAITEGIPFTEACP